MASSCPTCDTCSRQQKSTSAEIWCLECEESLCGDCRTYHAVSKATKDHNTLPITEYTSLPVFIQKIEKHCSKHNDQYTVYCHEHACPACTSCALEEHKLCSKVTKIDVVLSNAKSSSTLTEIEEQLCDISKHIESLQAERKKNVTSLQGQKSRIENEVFAIRQRINEHLDKIQSQIINDLHESENRERKKIEVVLKSLSIQKSQIEELQKNIFALRKHASDLQAFLAVREIEKRSTELVNKVTDMSHAGDFNNALLKHQEQNPTVLSDLSVDFGKIVTEVSPSNVILKLSKEKQAQLPVDILPSYSIESVSVKLNKIIDTGCQDTVGCVLLHDGRSLFTCYANNTVTSFDKDEHPSITKHLKPSSTFDIAYLEDKNTILISSGESAKKAIHEISLKNWKVKSLKTNSFNFGVIVKQNKLIYCAQNEGLCERSLSDGSVRVIVRERLPVYCYITEYRDQLYFTNHITNSVTCCGMDGRQIWKFTNDAFTFLIGISVDNYGNVYVVNKNTSNVVVISADGQRHKMLLSSKDGLEGPQVLHYQQKTNQLLVANEKGSAFIFDVSFS